MKSGEVQSVVKVFKMLGQFEMGLFEFYRISIEHWGADSGFLVDFTRDEVLHAENIAEMADIVSRKPERFGMARAFDVFSVSAAMAALKNNLQRLEKGELNKQQILSISRDMENWLLGFWYSNFLKTDDPEFQSLTKEVVLQTEAHKKTLEKKMAEMKRPAPVMGNTIRVIVIA